jgi:hypothetical protein
MFVQMDQHIGTFIANRVNGFQSTLNRIAVAFVIL